MIYALIGLLGIAALVVLNGAAVLVGRAMTAREELRGVAFDESHPRGILGDPLTTPLAALAYMFNESGSERHDMWGSRAKGALDFDAAGRRLALPSFSHGSRVEAY